MGDTPLHPPHSQSRPLRKAAGPYPMAWVLLFTAAGVAVARYATLPAGFLAAAFAAATLMAFITYRRRIGNGYIAIALLLLGMALPALRPQPAYGPAGTNRLHEAASERIRRLHLPPDAEAVALAMAAGDQTELTPERRAPYARTGTAHVLAVSGLHVGMVFLYVNLLLGALALLPDRAISCARRPSHKWLRRRLRRKKQIRVATAAPCREEHAAIGYGRGPSGAGAAFGCAADGGVVSLLPI